MKSDGARILSALLLSLCAAQAPAHQRVGAEASLVQCPLAGPPHEALLHVFDNAAQWRAAIEADAAAILGRDVHWRKERVVVFALERQPTLGVHVAFDIARAAARRGRLEMPVSVRRPAPGEMAATALSRPCAIAAVLREGWREVEVTDTQGRVLARQRVQRGAPVARAAHKGPDLRDVLVPAPARKLPPQAPGNEPGAR